MVRLNIGTKGLFTATLLLGWNDQVVASQAEISCLGVNAEGVSHQSSCTHTPLHPRCPPDVHRPERWI